MYNSIHFTAQNQQNNHSRQPTAEEVRNQSMFLLQNEPNMYQNNTHSSFFNGFALPPPIHSPLQYIKNWKKVPRVPGDIVSYLSEKQSSFWCYMCKNNQTKKKFKAIELARIGNEWKPVRIHIY